MRSELGDTGKPIRNDGLFNEGKQQPCIKKWHKFYWQIALYLWVANEFTEAKLTKFMRTSYMVE